MARPLIVASLLGGASFLFLQSVATGFVNWDVVYRARVLRTWEETTPLLVFNGLHVLELWQARVAQFLSVAPLDAIDALRRVTNFAGALSVGLLAWATWRVTGLASCALGASFTLAMCHGFWRVCAGGEEKAMAMTAILAATIGLLATYGELGRIALSRAAERRVVALVVAYGILNHLVAAVTVPAAVGASLLPSLGNQPRVRIGAVSAGIGFLLAGVVYLTIGVFWLGFRGPAELLGWVLQAHNSGYWMGNLGPTIQSYAMKLSTGLVTVVTANPALWIDFDGNLVHALCALLLGGALVLAHAARRTLPAGTRLIACMAIIWTAHFLFFEPNNLESWVPMLPVVLLLAWTGLAARMGSTPAGRAWLAGASVLVPGLLLTANLPVWRTMHQEPCTMRAARLLAPKLPSGTLLLCGWERSWVSSGEDLYYQYFGSSVPGLQVLQDTGDPQLSTWPCRRWVRAEIARAWREGRPVLVSSSIHFDPNCLPEPLEAVPELQSDCLTLRRLTPPPQTRDRRGEPALPPTTDPAPGEGHPAPATPIRADGERNR
ncbi:MAG: hypothetical protein HYY25_09160 [Candidatus Wallbacteria bacterium]|nr:hypothetical protein [Candidatus Wallbacteria bacterium]